VYVCYYGGVIETAPSSERLLAQNVWLRQTDADGQFVEIVMPPFELSDLLDECVHSFPQYVIQVCEVLAQREPELMSSNTRFTPEMIRGLMNTQILGKVLERQHVRKEKALPIMSELQQAFGLVMKGRLRLIADPIPDL